MANPLTNPLSTNNPIAQGPQYVDTAQCRCALQENTIQAWRCIGNETANLYDETSGKWFLPNAGTETNSNQQTSIYGGPPPNTTAAYLYSDDLTQDLVPITTANQVQLSALDATCNGKNDTDKTPIYYLKLANSAASGYVPQMCLEEGAVPVQIQNASEWDSHGCLPGFYCQYNDKNLLPEYCPPLPLCQAARMTGIICPEPMGILEPITCPAGSYCPNGKDKIDCPSGSYCPQGSVQPIACSPISMCPAKSVQNLTGWPLVLLIAVDFMIIAIFITIRIMNRKPKVKKMVPEMKQGLLANAAKYAAFRGGQKYEELDDDYEMEANIRTVRRANTGFDAALTHDNFRYSTLFNTTEPLEDKKDLQAFVHSLSKCLGATKFGLSFEFDQLRFQPKKSKKPILSDVTGFINSGSLWGVMGASGAGKSTFVNVLMGKTAHTGGVTRVNGVAGHISKYKKIIGYVPQDDVVSPELTVRENILHSARIRLPCTWSDVDIQKHVDILISCLQLSHVTDSLVGSQTKPVISGGQRKRVSIGMELAAAPMALFLDEPTSGLDATSASSIMNTLKAISRLGITIVTIIHQPRREIFESLDSLILLAAGKMIYQGKEAEVKPYFESLGYRFPELDNPADVVGDIIAGEGFHYKKAGDTNVQSLIDNWHDTHDAPKRASSPSGSSIDESLYSRAGSPSPSVLPISETLALQKSLKSRGAPWYKQIYFCFMRSMLQQWRLRSSFYSELGVSVIAGFLIGLAMLKSKGTNFRGIYLSPYDILSASIDYISVPQMALLVGLAIGLAASAPGVKIFGEEKLLYRREAEAGHNRFAYYTGKVISSFPRMILANLHFTVLFILLATPRMSFVSSFSVNLMYFYCIYGLASCVSMITRREDGPLIATMTSLIIGVLNGMSPSLVAVKDWHMLWFWRICPGTWLAEAYFTENILPWGYLYQIDLVQVALGYNFGQYAMDVLMLFALGSAYRVVAFGGLRLFNG